MFVTRTKHLAASAAASIFFASAALAGGGYGPGTYGMPYGGGMGYGPAMGYGPQGGYGAPMGYPSRPEPPLPPQRPTPPERPTMGGAYGYGSGMPKPPMPNYYRAPQRYGAPQPAASMQPTAPADAVEQASVSISQMRFTTPTVTVKAGGTVTWTNSEGMPHTVTANDGSFGSSQLGAGETYSHTFNKPGTYSYYCTLHPSMRATVVVVG